MKKILAFNGSPRKNGNTSILLEKFKEGTSLHSSNYEVINPYEINLKYCTGCLRCNLVKKCTIRDDEWEILSKKITEADILVFASPVYFHHLTAPLKKILDRFRSFVKVQMNETGLEHVPHSEWNKDFVLLLSMGSSDDIDAKPIIELFEFLTLILGIENNLHIIKATRLGVISQVEKKIDELEILYEKLNLPLNLAKEDYFKNQSTLEKCFKLGESLTK